MDVLSPTFLTVLLCFVSTVLTQTTGTPNATTTPESTSVNPTSSITTSSIASTTKVSTPTTETTSVSTPTSTVTTSVSTPTSTETTSVSTPSSTETTPSSTASTSVSTPSSNTSTSVSTPSSTASTSVATTTSTARTSVTTPSSSGSSLPTPTASPASDNPHWNLKNKDGFYCILLEMSTTISFSKLNITDTNSVENFDLSISNNNTIVDDTKSQCDGSTNSVLMLNINGKVNGTKVYPLTGSLKFNFQNQSTTSYSLDSIEFDFAVQEQKFPPSRYNMSIKVPEGKAHQCKNEGKKEFSDEVTLQFQNFEFAAFISANDTKLDKFDVCSQDEGTSDVVPIAVGCALAALVVIILIAYLIGRRRNRQRGYQSV